MTTDPVLAIQPEPKGSSERPHDVTLLIGQAQAGDQAAAAQLLKSVYEELRRMAASKLKNLPGQTLQPTALVHEVLLRLVLEPKKLSIKNRGHFYAVAAIAMRNVLVEYSRRRQAVKRGGDRARVELNEDVAIAGVADRIDFLDLHEALGKLEIEDPRACKAIMLKYFVGLSVMEIAESEGVSESSVEKDLRFGRSFIEECLGEEWDSQNV